jgi:hypothetical protein
MILALWKGYGTFSRSRNELQFYQVQYKRDLVQYKRDLVQYKRDLVQYKRDLVQYKRDLVQYKRDLVQYKRDLVQYKRDLWKGMPPSAVREMSYSSIRYSTKET